MNRELEALILAYEKVSTSKDKDAARHLFDFELLLDKVMQRQPRVSRDFLRQGVIKAHRKWAMQQDRKRSAIPPKA
jgi:hypothetical protein